MLLLIPNQLIVAVVSYYHRSEKFPGRHDDRGVENELTAQRRIICDRVRRAASQALAELRTHAEETEANPDSGTGHIQD